MAAPPHDLHGVHSFAQLPLIRAPAAPPSSGDSTIRLFGRDFSNDQQQAAPLLLRKQEDDAAGEDGVVVAGEGGDAVAAAGERTPHAALAVVSRGQGATDHKKADNYYHYVAGRMVPNA